MLDISDKEAWFAALAFGAIMVGSFYWSRFDQTTYEDKSQYFRLYAPRFSTPGNRYRNARVGYVVVLIAIFVFFSFFPTFLEVLATGELAEKLNQRPQGSAVPLIVAMVIMGLQNVPGLRLLEIRIRSGWHAFGKIPDGVRRTVSQIRGALFDFDSHENFLQQEVTRLASAAGDQRVTADLVKSDAVLRRWCKISCLLDRISDRGAKQTHISDSFLETYDEELESITARRDALAHRVNAYIVQAMESVPVDADEPFEATLPLGNEGPGDANLQRELSKLRDRLYTFIACGLRSSLTTGSLVPSALRGLGFDVRSGKKRNPGILEIAGLFLITVVSITVFTVFVSLEFNQQYVAGLDLQEGLLSAIAVPQDYWMLWLWTIFSAAFYLVAVTGALVPRAMAITRLDWFDLDQDKRHRPFGRYVGPIVAGGLCGYLALCLIQVFTFLLTASGPNEAGLMAHAKDGMRQSLCWIPLAIIVSFFALWVSDAELRKRNWIRNLSRAFFAATAMALVGWLISEMNTTYVAQGIVGDSDLPDGFEKARSRANVVVAIFIALFTTLLMVLIQRHEQNVLKKEGLAGNWLTMRGANGETCEIQLEPDGTVVHAPGDLRDTVVAGTWTQFPAGHVIKWSAPLQLGEHWLQDRGLLLREGGSILFEEYSDESKRVAEFVAQVVQRTNGTPPDEPDTASVVPLRVA